MVVQNGWLMTPTLIIVSGPPGSGKTTCAHQIARAVGCPAVCRDEIKEGMAHATPGFVGGAGDDLTRRTLPVFFEVIELLLKAGVTTVAEAAATITSASSAAAGGFASSVVTAGISAVAARTATRGVGKTGATRHMRCR
jgi:predicted kinase